MKISTNTKKQLELLFYKLLNDALLLWLGVFGFMLIVESIIPGYFFNPAKLTALVFVLFLLLGTIAFLGKRNSIFYAPTDTPSWYKNKLFLFFLVFSGGLILNSLRNLSMTGIIIFSLSSITLLLIFTDFFIRPKK